MGLAYFQLHNYYNAFEKNTQDFDIFANIGKNKDVSFKNCSIYVKYLGF